jgi:predicted TPR repeat methyltransferase
MKILDDLKRALWNRWLDSRWYPHIVLSRSPFKVVEFHELTRGIRNQPADVMLDLGCGAGLQTMLLARGGGRIVGVDVSEGAVNRARS